MKNSPTLAFVIAGWLFAAGIAPADTLTWTNLTGPGTNWTTAGNWTNGGGANAAPSTTSGSPDDVVFGYAATNTASFSLNNTAFYVNDLIATNAAYAFGTGTKILAAPGGSGGKLVMQAVGADLPSLAIRNDETNVLAQRNITITAPIELDADTVFQRLGTVSPNFARSVSFSGPISGGSPGVPLTVAFDNEDPGSFYRKLVIGGTNTFYATNVTLNGTIAMGSARAFGNPTNDIFTAGLRNTRVYTDFGGGTIDQDWHLTTNAFTTYLEATRQFAGGTNDFVFAGAFTGGRNGFNSLTFQATGENTFILTSTNQAFAGTATLTLDSEVIVAGANASALAWENANGVTMASGDRITGFSNERTALLLRGNYSLTQNVTIANATPANSGTNVNLLGQVNDGITAFDTRFTGKINVQETDYTAFGLFADTNGTARFEGNIFGTGGQGFLVNPSMNATSKLTLGVGEGLVVVASNAVVALTDGGSASIGTVRVLNGKFQVDTTNFFANVAVEGDALLQGNGRIRGNVTVSNTAAVGPGASIGSLGVDGDADINGTLRIEVNPAGAGAADFLNVTGLLDLAYATIDFDAFGPLDDLYYIFAEYGSLLGDDTVTLADLPAGYWVDFNYQGLNQIALVIPESSVWLALAPAALALLAWRRRKNLRTDEDQGENPMNTHQPSLRICKTSLRDGGPAMDSSRGGAEARRKSMACEASRRDAGPDVRGGHAPGPRGRGMMNCMAPMVGMAREGSGGFAPRTPCTPRGSAMDSSRRDAEARRGTPYSSAYSAYSAVALLVALLFLAPPSRAVTIDLVTVGNPGNAPDPLNTNSVPGIGSVAYTYQIAKFEVRNSEYVDFLNAVAAADTWELYNTSMGLNPEGGITRGGAPGSYVYVVKAHMADKPVNYVDYFDAVRFVNWLANGQPTGTNQVAGTTETGSYTLFNNGSFTTNVSSRAANATWVIPTENEWYKAAYNQPSGSGGPGDNYWLYPTQSDSVPAVGLADTTGSITNDGPNVANYNLGADWNGRDGNVTTVGSAGASSDSYYGTFDQGGNVWEWNDTIISGQYRVFRGAGWNSTSSLMASSFQTYDTLWGNYPVLGFRVAFLPIPEPGAFIALGLAALAVCVGRKRRRSGGVSGTLVALAAVFLLPPPSSRAVTIDLVTVGDPGNAPDPFSTNSVPGIGSVSYSYSIGKYEVRNSEYVDFLNAVADTDTYGLYSTSMASDARGGINRSGSSGSYTYAVKTGYDNMPVTFVSFYDAVRFANWIQNGQPTGAQGAGTTETGSYTLFTDGGTTTNVSARAANATWVIPTENEWYKAAYYDPTASGTTNYWLYPTQSDSIPNSRPPDGTDANSANFYRDAVPSGDGVNDGYAKTGSTTYESATNYLTDAGAYALAASYYGTFDQGGNVWEWNETLVGDSNRRLRGGSWLAAANSLRSTFLNDNLPTSESLVLGFRVAAIPEPGAWLALAPAALGLLARRRRRKLQKADKTPRQNEGENDMRTPTTCSGEKPGRALGAPVSRPAKGSSHGDTEARRKSMARKAARSAQVPLAPPKAAAGLPHSEGGAAILIAFALLCLPTPGRPVTFQMVTVSNVNNAADSTGYGSVSYLYSMEMMEIANLHYTEFLNAVADTDTYGLYNTSMASDPRGGITRSGASGSYTYAVKTYMGAKPVNFVSYYDAVRFANWMANGQPTGGQTNGVTETGSYTLTGATSVGARDANATWVIPTENEWYKAAYYDPSASGPSDDYWLYPTRSDSVPTMGLVDAWGNIINDGPNVANYGTGADWNGQDGNVTSIGSTANNYPVGASYYGTLDQGGNVNEWTETILGSFRVLRGGGWANSEAALRATTQGFDSPTVEDVGLGFRLALIPEPGPIAALGLLGLAAVALRLRKRKKDLSHGTQARRKSLASEAPRSAQVPLAPCKAAVALPHSESGARQVRMDASHGGSLPAIRRTETRMGTPNSSACSAVALVVALLFLAAPSRAVTIDLVPVGDPGNAPDPLNTNTVPGIGSVAYTYGIGKFEVFNSQYVDFLNAVADTDTYGLYNASMDTDARGGIIQSGSSGSYTYSLKSGYENMPVVFVSFYDAVRFANWLENGQPTGAQGAGTTETGSYTLFTSGSSTTNVSARAANATWVIPTENEWYKAAYYDPTASGTTNYWLYPTQSDSIPNSRPPNGTDANSANFYRDDGSPDDFLNDGYAKTGSTSFNSATNYLTAVGSYSVADSYYGTFDQGGNVWEWDETRFLRGGGWNHFENGLRSSDRGFALPSSEFEILGFRVALIPEPGAFVALGLVGLVGWRFRKKSTGRRTGGPPPSDRDR